ncbi:MAG: hypothetical protein EHM48_01495, partial [Planctomycetaceae bacterium]
MKLWTGSNVEDVPLSWHGKRLMKDLALRGGAAGGKKSIGVSRADRLGLAAGDTPNGYAVHVLGLLEQKDWNGRLQAPRRQLDAIAAVRDNSKLFAAVKAARLDKLTSRIKWLVTFSAKLQPQGPWIDFAKTFSDDAHHKPFVSRKGGYAVKHSTNETRQGHGKLLLSRLPGLRLLSVDLGRRYVAACAVWETIATKQVLEVCRDAGHEPPKPSDIYLHSKSNDGKKTIYRRIGPDKLPNGKLHPAPWARLDRQFLIKLQGEQRPTRRALEVETALVSKLISEFGLVPDKRRTRERGVDGLMSDAVSIASNALKRHARRAKIAYALDPATTIIFGTGTKKDSFKPGDEKHIGLLTDALCDWHALAGESKWNDKGSRNLWNQWIASFSGAWTIPDPSPADPAAVEKTRQQRRKDDDELRERIKPIAQQLARKDHSADLAAIHKAWKTRWEKDDGTNAIVPKPVEGTKGPRLTKVQSPATGFHEKIRCLTNWIMGRRLSGSDNDKWRKNVGGLSLTRIATMKSLYQLHKAFAMRAKPDRPRGAPEKGETNAGIAMSILDAMERIRLQRVKQLASRIVEGALGIGIEQNNGGKKDLSRPRERIDTPRFAPCHAVVIENLTNYRPEETQTRRENRQLMEWSSSKVEKYLTDACQLCGLHLREVAASYTSQQDSRTGAPGVRCKDVPVADFVKQSGFLSKRIQDAIRKNETEEHRYLAELYSRWNETAKTWTDGDGTKWKLGDDGKWLSRNGKPLAPKENMQPHPIRIPQRGGEVFVSAKPCDCCKPANRKGSPGLQADLNAAANIGLRALLDPDWHGKWWYVPCDRKTFKPVKDKVKGGIADIDVPLLSVIV